MRLGGRFGDGGPCEIFNPVDPDNQDVILGHSYDGILRDYLVDEIPSHSVVPAHSDLPVDLGPLVEPTATAHYAWELMRAHLHPAGSVVIFGGGSAALLLAMLGEDLGYRIHLVHPRHERLRFITELGVLRSATVTDTAPPDSADGAVVCVHRDAANAAIEQAVNSVADDGVLDLFGGIPTGLHHPALPNNDLSAVRRANVCGRGDPVVTSTVTSCGKRLRLTGHRGTSATHIHQAQRRLATASPRYGTLITQVVSLDEAAHRIPLMAQRDRSCGEHVKVVVDLTMPQRARSVDLGATVIDQLGSHQ
ncbi:dehydrogenase [Nocardia transvalensis]|uniref:dehydrogenase n=1 Tax=Nocardia transvalensis TaxID=37333 RepID=UPI001895BE7F|nr:dehydrogenase [Nocardia transvalensis]MBF6333198.1 dehydrogenase [Nocardia transvalensis]